MATIQTVREVCARALRRTGVLSPYEQAADPQLMAIAQDELDSMVRHYTGAHRMPWLHDLTVKFAPPAGQASFDLLDFLPAGTAPEGVQYPVSATYNEQGQTPDLPISLWRRSEYEAIERKSDEGRPEGIHIDRRQPKPKAFVWRVQPTSGTPVYEINLVYQEFVPDLSGRDTKNEIVTTLPETWNLWMVTQLAALIGSGPVVRLDRGEQRDLRDEAGGYLNDLLAYANDEQADQPRNCAYNDASGTDPTTYPRRPSHRFYSSHKHGYR